MGYLVRMFGCWSAETFSWKAFVAVTPSASVAVNFTLNVPVAVGTPHSSASPGLMLAP